MIALGNGTACRETETIISDCITQKLFSPHKVKYCIVNEDGSSVYSVSEIGEKELPNLDQNHRSAGECEEFFTGETLMHNCFELNLLVSPFRKTVSLQLELGC